MKQDLANGCTPITHPLVVSLAIAVAVVLYVWCVWYRGRDGIHGRSCVLPLVLAAEGAAEGAQAKRAVAALVASIPVRCQ